MSDQGRWFKLWVSALSDPDLSNLGIDDFGRWCKLGAYMKAHGTDGTLKILPPARTLCAYMQVVTMEELLACISRFPNCQIRHDDGVTINVTNAFSVTWRNWRKYQVDSSAERMRRKRYRDAVDVTPKKRREEKRRSNTAEGEIFWSGEIMKITLETHTKLCRVYDERLAIAEYPKADLWLQNNPKRKRSNFASFMAGWLEKASSRAPKGGGNVSSGPNYF